MNLKSVAKIAYHVAPKCKYTLRHSPVVVDHADTATLFDARGFYQQPAKTDTIIEGFLTRPGQAHRGVVKNRLERLEHGIGDTSIMALVTDVDLPLPSMCAPDYRSEYTLVDTDGKEYALSDRVVKGCVFMYLCTLVCEPVCP